VVPRHAAVRLDAVFMGTQFDCPVYDHLLRLGVTRWVSKFHVPCRVSWCRRELTQTQLAGLRFVRFSERWAHCGNTMPTSPRAFSVLQQHRNGTMRIKMTSSSEWTMKALWLAIVGRRSQLSAPTSPGRMYAAVIYIGNWEADLLYGARCRLQLVFIIASHPGFLFGHNEGRLTGHSLLSGEKMIYSISTFSP